jgi:prevent-host-death family protein
MRVPIHEFKSQLAKYVAQARSGQTIELTSHSKVVAHIVGVPQSASDGVTRLLEAGAATWQGGKPKGASLVLRGAGKPLSTMVLEDRG